MADPTSEHPEPSSQFVQSLARGLDVIKAFTAEHPEMTLSDIARATDLTRATARRFLLTLAELGYVRSDGRLFALTPRVLELGFSYLSGLSLPEVAQPHLERLSRELGESTSASVLDGGDIVYIARVPTRRIMTVGITIGTRFPAYATSMGRVLLANLPRAELDAYLGTLHPAAFTPTTLTDVGALRAELDAAQERGWTIVDQELEVGLRSVAAPVRRGAAVVAAINVSTTTGTSSLERLTDEFVPALLAAADRIAADLALVR
ncbi:IclR family transcriptional regulator C-terminal domain-containing protein [Herbiconiux sp. P17]|uniref:IclR family transcriptional regulator domain-containing protein n=1 Tax=Herbiconiux wuyangfengii TaxID=3342794 RepID=UPI0035BB6B5A